MCQPQELGNKAAWPPLLEIANRFVIEMVKRSGATEGLIGASPFVILSLSLAQNLLSTNTSGPGSVAPPGDVQAPNGACCVNPGQDGGCGLCAPLPGALGRDLARVPSTPCTSLPICTAYSFTCEHRPRPNGPVPQHTLSCLKAPHTFQHEMGAPSLASEAHPSARLPVACKPCGSGSCLSP